MKRSIGHGLALSNRLPAGSTPQSPTVYSRQPHRCRIELARYSECLRTALTDSPSTLSLGSVLGMRQQLIGCLFGVWLVFFGRTMKKLTLTTIGTVAAVLAFSTGCSQNKIEELSTQLDDAQRTDRPTGKLYRVFDDGQI